MDYLQTRGDQANKGRLTDAQPYDMESIQIAALRAVIHNRDKVILAQEAQIVALMMEIEQLRASIGALEVESIEPGTAVVFDDLPLPVHCYG